MDEQLAFYILAGIMILASTAVILTRNPIVSATLLIANLFSVACLYALLNAHFVAAIQVLVYAGAIMVLFLFVIMLLNLKKEHLHGPKLSFPEHLVLGLTAATFLYIASLLHQGEQLVTNDVAVNPENASNTFNVGMQLFTKYLWPFEMASFLILLAIIASVVIAKKDKAPKSVIKASNRGV